MIDLIQAARKARSRAYAPYSKFQVGCALRTKTGAIHTGCNIENAAYPTTLCAERVAVGNMIAAGDREIAEIVVIGTGDAPSAPCGNCRQTLNEHAQPTTPILMMGEGQRQIRATLGDLLPHAFGPDDLGMTNDHASSLEAIRKRHPDERPKVGLILGSGLGSLADRLDRAASIGYDDIPGFPKPTVEGHAGRLVFGDLEGVRVACLQGRVHLYEGGDPAMVAHLVRTLRDLGCHTLIITSAVGSLREDLRPGMPVCIEDHINLQGRNPLVGPNDGHYGPRFPDMSAVYDRRLCEIAMQAAKREGIQLGQGVFTAWLGPCFETPAEIRASRILGGDVVGMSMVPEAIAAAHCGLKTLGIAVVTNYAAGMQQSLSHEETVKVGGEAAPRVERLLRSLIAEFAEDAT